MVGCSLSKQNVEKFGDHFGGKPTSAGRTFTGGSDFFLKFSFLRALLASRGTSLEVTDSVNVP